MTERPTLSQVNQGLMDAMGLGELAHKCRSVQVSLHATSWPTARLDLVINKSLGQTERRYVRLVPEDIETEQPVKGFDIDAACDQARAAVATAIEEKAEQVRFVVRCIFSTIKFPLFEVERPVYAREAMAECSNAEAWAAFRDFHGAMMLMGRFDSLAPSDNAQALFKAKPDGIRRTIAWLPKGILFYVLAGMLLLIPACLELSSRGSAEKVHQPIKLDVTGGLAEHSGLFALGDQPAADRFDSSVVVLSDIPPQSGSMPKKDTQEKRQDRNRGALQKFFDEHPVASNFLLAMLTLLSGFAVGGGFTGGTR